MSATFIGSALVALMACADPPAEQGPAAPPAFSRRSPQEALADCERYAADLPDVYGLCLKQAIVAVQMYEEMLEVCAKAGPWREECHWQWVDEQARYGRYTAKTLLDACGPSADCALQRLDAAPAEDVVEQMTLCQRAGVYANDCVGHALQRWVAARPGPDEVLRVAGRSGGYQVQVGTFIGMIVACQGTTACPEGETQVAESCRIAVAGQWRDPRVCQAHLLLPPR